MHIHGFALPSESLSLYEQPFGTIVAEVGSPEYYTFEFLERYGRVVACKFACNTST
jgi:hypothetical protein